MWQRSDGEAVCKNILNDFVKEMSESLNQTPGEQITISKLSQLTMCGTISYSIGAKQVINPSNSNTDRNQGTL